LFDSGKGLPPGMMWGLRRGLQIGTRPGVAALDMRSEGTNAMTIDKSIGREMPWRRRGPAGARTGSLILDRHLSETLEEERDTLAAREELKRQREARQN
jgi:hypothetical protein